MTNSPSDLSLSDIPAIDTETMQSRVHRQLRELLMMGRFQPGQAVKIIELAEVFGTSAQPVRESIRQLVAERALDALPNRSALVPVLDRERIEDLRRVRLAIEGLAVELATERVTPEDIAQLRRLMADGAEADEAGDIEGRARHNMRFHFALYRIAGSSTLMSFIENLWLQIGPAMRQSAHAFDARDGRGSEMHARMIEGLERGDKVMVKQALADDIGRSFHLLLAAADAR